VRSFGGLGGHAGTRPWEAYADDLFAQALNRALGARIRESDLVARAVWGSLANCDWYRQTDQGEPMEAWYSFRAAGDLIASIRGKGDYMDWYCSAPAGVVDQEVADAMAKEDWYGAGLNRGGEPARPVLPTPGSLSESSPTSDVPHWEHSVRTCSQSPSDS
jgi:hypothetical protein